MLEACYMELIFFLSFKNIFVLLTQNIHVQKKTHTRAIHREVRSFPAQQGASKYGINFGYEFVHTILVLNNFLLNIFLNSSVCEVN